MTIDGEPCEEDFVASSTIEFLGENRFDVRLSSKLACDGETVHLAEDRTVGTYDQNGPVL